MTGKEAYQEYLQTDTWKTIRAQRLAMDNEECVLCGEKAEHVHHRRYPKKWGTETIKDLVSLCAKCHKKHHGDKSPYLNGALMSRISEIEKGNFSFQVTKVVAAIFELSVNNSRAHHCDIEDLKDKIKEIEERLAIE